MHDIRSSIELLVSIDLTTTDLELLDRAAGATQRVRGFVAACDSRITRRRDELRRAILHGQLDGTDADRPGSDPPGGAPPGGPPPGVPGPGGPDPSLIDALPPIDDRRSPTETERLHTRAGAGATFPRFEEALATGALDQEHLDALAAAWRMLDGDEQRDAQEAFLTAADELLEHALVERPDRFRRRCRDLARALLADHGIRLLERQRRESSFRRWFDKRTGMHHTAVTLDPERGALFDAVVDSWGAHLRATEATSGLPWQELQVEAFCRMAGVSQMTGDGRPAASLLDADGDRDRDSGCKSSGDRGSNGPGADSTGARWPQCTSPSVELSVLIDLPTLTSGIFEAGSICETSSGVPLPPETVRRMACEADLLPIVLSGDGLPLDVGRRQRLATAAQRRALRAIHRTCAHPNCDRPFDQCRIHHLDYWEHGGATDLHNLLPVCTQHHHSVHEGGWRVILHDDRTTTWFPPGSHLDRCHDHAGRTRQAELRQ